MFFQSACDVPELEEKFNIDEYSDMVTLSKPVIYISIEEIINTHSVNPNANIHGTFELFCLCFSRTNDDFCRITIVYSHKLANI